MSRAIRFNVRMRYLSLSAVLVAACVVLPATAQGQAGQSPDPDSPAGVEYQLPLEQARKNAAGQGNGEPRRGGSGEGGWAAPLFGAGIAARDVEEDRGTGGRPGSQGGEGGSDSESSASKADRGNAAPGEAGGSDAAISRSAVGGADSDDSATQRTLGIALAVLLAGGLLGVGLRRGLRQSAD